MIIDKYFIIFFLSFAVCLVNICTVCTCFSSFTSIAAENLVEYQWPPDSSGDYYMLQEQVSTFLNIKSFKRKYPGILKYCKLFVIGMHSIGLLKRLCSYIVCS